MEQFKDLEAAFNWLASKIRNAGIFQEPVNAKNRMDNWSIDRFVLGVFELQLMDGGYSRRIRHQVDGWSTDERLTFGNKVLVTVDGIKESEFLSIASLLKDAVDNAG